MSLNTKYLGLNLKNPIIIGSSSLTDSVDKIISLANSGAGAVVLKSFFEEQVNSDLAKIESMAINQEHTEAFEYIQHLGKENEISLYTTLISESKKSVDIPVIASINCVTEFEWSSYAKKMENAGADAIELNIFYNEVDPNISSEEIINRYCKIISETKKTITIPMSIKITDKFTNIARAVDKFISAGADGVVLFNKFHSPDIDIENEVITNSSINSNTSYSSSLRWIGILAKKYNADFSATTGVNDAETVIKQLLAGADTIQITSAIYKNGNATIAKILNDIEVWMQKKGYRSLEEFRGKLSQSNLKDPFTYERFQFIAPISK